MLTTHYPAHFSRDIEVTVTFFCTYCLFAQVTPTFNLILVQHLSLSRKNLLFWNLTQRTAIVLLSMASPNSSSPTTTEIYILSNPVLDLSELWARLPILHPFTGSPLEPSATFFGPILPRNKFPEGMDKLYPNIGGEEILISRESVPIHYFAKAEQLFRVPDSSVDGYTFWLDHFQESKAQHWMDLDIFKVIQLSCLPFLLEQNDQQLPPLLWNDGSNTLWGGSHYWSLSWRWGILSLLSASKDLWCFERCP